MSGKRKRVVYIPYPVQGQKINEYTVNMVNILSKKYEVCGEMAEPMDIAGMLHTKAVFLNWVEEKLDHKMKRQLMLHRLFGTKIVWVFHNKQPHDGSKLNDMMCRVAWLADHSSCILLHSKSSRKYLPNAAKNQRKAVYLPHVMYKSEVNRIDLGEIRSKYGIEKNDFVFVIFGMIRPYKNIEKGIEAFQKLALPNAKLLIAGNPVDSQYAREIEKMCEGCQNIILDLRYISNTLLDGIIGISDVVVLPYQNRSSMNSGVMIQAFSNGTPVIAPDICMARDMVKEGFLYGYRSSVGKAMKKAYANGKEVNREMGQRALRYMNQNHSEEVVAEQLFSILGTVKK